MVGDMMPGPIGPVPKLRINASGFTAIMEAIRPTPAKIN